MQSLLSCGRFQKFICTLHGFHVQLRGIHEWKLTQYLVEVFIKFRKFEPRLSRCVRFDRFENQWLYFAWCLLKWKPIQLNLLMIKRNESTYIESKFFASIDSIVIFYFQEKFQKLGTDWYNIFEESNSISSDLNRKLGVYVI